MVLYIGSLILGNIDVHFQYRHTRDRYVPLTELGEGMAGWYRALIVHYETLVETGNISHSNAEANLYEAFKVLGGKALSTISHVSACAPSRPCRLSKARATRLRGLRTTRSARAETGIPAATADPSGSRAGSAGEDAMTVPDSSN